MKTLLPSIAVALTTLLLSTSAIYAKKKGDGFVSLFNGKDLKGWKTPGGDHAWKVVDGVIDYEAKGGNLTSEKSYENYV